jgi:asparagine synthase (glutamine-hydrolysing)
MTVGILVSRRSDFPLDDAARGMRDGMAWRHVGELGLTVDDGVRLIGAPGSAVFSDDRIALVADCRLDNADWLRNALDLPGAGVGELIARAFDRWEEAAPRHLEGDFAGAAFDKRRRRLWVFRDRFGARPWFVFAGDAVWACGSTPDAILRSGALEARLDTVRLIEALAGEDLDGRRTAFRGIERVPPATVLVVSDTGTRERRYWAPPSEVDASRTPEETATELQERLSAAVAARAQGPGGTAIQLSGGLDSSAIAVLADAMAIPFTPVSMRFSGRYAAIDEGPFIDEVRRSFPNPSIELDGAAATTLGSFFDLAHTWYEPSIAPNHQFNLAMFERVSQAGYARCLDGFDGDSVISHGWETFSDLARAGQLDAWATLARCVEANGFRTAEATMRASLPVLVDQALRGHVLGSVGSMLRLSRLGGFPLPAVITQASLALKARARLRVPSRFVKSYLPLSPEAIGELMPALLETERRRMARPSETSGHIATLTNPLMGFALEILDHHARRAGIQTFHPFLAADVVDLTVSTTPMHKIRDGTRTPCGVSPLHSRGSPSAISVRETYSAFCPLRVQSLRAFEGRRRGGRRMRGLGIAWTSSIS